MIKQFIIFSCCLLGAICSEAQSMPEGLQANSAAPLFAAKDQDGKMFNLKQQLDSGSVVLVFYRGQWCPYCNRQLQALEDSLSLITAKGAKLVAITPELPENVKKTVAKTNATYPLLYDEGLKIMQAYKVAFAVDTATITKYKGYGIDFEKANGDNGANLPVPAVYIVNKDGIITYKYFNPDYRKRPTVAELLSHL